MATTKITVKTAPFSPYHAACDMGAVAHSGGINWSYATFENKLACEAFDRACNANGYRTRNMTRQLQQSGPDTWSVQYHHYQD